MEVQIGEFVRTSKGKIFKYGKGRAYLGKDNRIVKHSFEIKELIEKNDIVEYTVNKLKIPKIARVRKYKEARTFKEYLGIEGYKLEQIKIIRLLTKEQFQNVSYEV